MRTGKYRSSERAVPSNALASAQVISLDVHSDRGYRSPTHEPPGSKSKPRLGHPGGRELNGQRSSERRRLTAHDLQNLLCSIDVATILLDADLNIRFFTPATRLVFNVIPGDIGRPLTDLSSLAPDTALVSDARKVLQQIEPIEREIETPSGAWYVRRILPYQSEGKGIEGIVITLVDVTRQKQTAAVLEQARVKADSANTAKSRLLAAASHDLRQPLQTLMLLQELLAQIVVGDKARLLIGRLDQTLVGMSGMLNALLDINQIEAGAVRTRFETFRIDAVLNRVTDDLAFQADAKRIALHVVPCTLTVRSDPRLLEQMIRNLLANAIKFTKQGRVLIGCRRRSGKLIIQIWDTGVGIPETQIQEIFEEYHQIDNAACDRSPGWGLGLSIVKRLGSLLDHRVTVSSRLGKGSVFSVEVQPSPARGPNRSDGSGRLQGQRQKCHDLIKPTGLKDLVAAAQCLAPEPARASTAPVCPADVAAGSAPVIFVVDDDSEVRQAIRSMLEHDGRLVEEYPDGEAFLDLYRLGRQGCLLVDANLPGISGLDLLKHLKESGHQVPAIMISGQNDVPIAVEAMKAGASDVLQKPIRGVELLEGVRRALELSRESAKRLQWHKQAADHLVGLTRRQHQIMAMVLAGHPSKNIAADLGISQRTVENHRASIMRKSGMRSLPALARLAVAAADSHDRPPA